MPIPANSTGFLPRFALPIVALLVALGGCSRGDWHLTGATMGTTYSVRIVAPETNTGAKELQSEIDAELSRITALMSTYVDDSQLSRFNSSDSGDWVSVDSDVVAVVDAALRASAISDGAFDPTVGPLVELWGFGRAGPRDTPPPQSEIDAAMATVGFGLVSTREEPPALRKLAPAVALDLSALAKGYAVDRIDWLLDSRGLTRYMIEIGGEVKTRGRNQDGEPWRIAVERPLEAERSVYTVLQLSGEAIATSGDYRNFFEIDGRRYFHAIDPRSGQPAGNDLASVTIVAASAMEADAMATAMLVLGPDKGMRLANEQRIAALFLRRDGDEIVARHSQAFAPYLADGDAK